MDIYVSIILGIFIIVLIYLLYSLYVGGSGKSLIPNQVNLLTNGMYSVPSTSIIQNNSSNYTMSIWVNVNTWNTKTPKTIYASTTTGGGKPTGITYGKNEGTSYPLNPNNLQVPTSISNVIYTLTLDSNSPNLYFNIGTTDISNNVSFFVPVLITNNFPLQKWTNIIVSVSQGNVFDFYIDGNLVSSNTISNVSMYNTNDYTIKQTNVVVNVPTSTCNIILGGDATPADISVSRLIRYTYSINPQDAKTIYQYGSGVSTSVNYNVDLSLIKDNNIFSQLKLM